MPDKQERRDLLVQQTEDQIRRALISLDEQIKDLDLTVCRITLEETHVVPVLETSRMAELDVVIGTQSRIHPTPLITKDRDTGKWLVIVEDNNFVHVTISEHDMLCEAEKVADVLYLSQRNDAPNSP